MAQAQQLHMELAIRLIHRSTGINLNGFYSTFCQLVEFCRDIFELYQHLQKEIIPVVKKQIFDLWAKHCDVLIQLFGLSWNVIKHLSANTDVRIQVLGILKDCVRGIPVAIQLLSIGNYISQVYLFFEHRKVFKELTESFDEIERKISDLRNMTAELENLVNVYSNKAQHDEALFRQIQQQFNAAKAFDDRQFRRLIDDLRPKMNEHLVLLKTNQNNLKVNAIGSFTTGTGSLIAGMLNYFSIGTALINLGLGTISGISALYFNAEIKKDMQQLEKGLQKLNDYEQELEETVRKINELEEQHLIESFNKMN